MKVQPDPGQEPKQKQKKKPNPSSNHHIQFDSSTITISSSVSPRYRNPLPYKIYAYFHFICALAYYILNLALSATSVDGNVFFDTMIDRSRCLQWNACHFQATPSPSQQRPEVCRSNGTVCITDSNCWTRVEPIYMFKLATVIGGSVGIFLLVVFVIKTWRRLKRIVDYGLMKDEHAVRILVKMFLAIPDVVLDCNGSDCLCNVTFNIVFLTGSVSIALMGIIAITTQKYSSCADEIGLVFSDSYKKLVALTFINVISSSFSILNWLSRAKC